MHHHHLFFSSYSFLPDARFEIKDPCRPWLLLCSLSVKEEKVGHECIKRWCLASSSSLSRSHCCIVSVRWLYLFLLPNRHSSQFNACWSCGLFAQLLMTKCLLFLCPVCSVCLSSLSVSHSVPLFRVHLKWIRYENFFSFFSVGYFSLWMRIFFLSSSEEEGKVNITFRQRFLGRMRYTCNSSWEVKRKGGRIQEEGIETCFVRRGKDSL